MIRFWPFTSGPAAETPLPAAVAEGPYAAVLEALPDPLLVIRSEIGSRDRRIVFANAAAREFFRLSSEGAPMLIAAVRRPEVLDLIEMTLVQDAAGEVAFEAQERILRAISRPLAHAADGARLALLSIRDETDAWRSERMRADFLANASHELRTPLASVKGFIETLRGHAKDDPVARDKFLAIMARQTDRMGRLIEDLMSLSRIELNEHVRPEGKVDVGLVASDVVDAAAPIAAKNGVALDLRAEPKARIKGDRDQIVQVIQNLVDNAVKYTPAGRAVTIEVLRDQSEEAALRLLEPSRTSLPLIITEHEPNTRFVVVRVSDLGPGIERDQLPRLAERFYRAPGQKSGELSGTGLGLAIVKHIVNRHRGGLVVESAPRQGATFTVYLPAWS